MPSVPELLPRHHTARSDWPTRGGQLAAVAAAKRKPFMPWQRLAADVCEEYDPRTGLPRFGIVIVTVPRQAGKTTFVGVKADAQCIRRPGSRVWVTFQTGKMADSWMRNEHVPSLRAIGDPKSKASPYRVSLRAGEAGPIWQNGSTFFTFPPLRDALHSKQSDLAIISEAWALTAEQGSDVRQAIRPTMLTRPAAQLLVESTVGDDASVFLDGYLELGVASLSDPDTRVCFIDYGIPEDADPDDLDVIAAHHPAYGHTVTMQALIDARAEFEADPELGGSAGFARAYGNRPTRTRLAAFGPGVWDAAGTEQAELPERAGLAFDVTPLGDDVGVTFSWRGPDHAGRERAFLETVPCPSDLDAAADHIAALARRRKVPVGYDTVGAATLDLADRIAKRHRDVKLRGLTTREYVTACSRLDLAVKNREAAHFRQPKLTAAVESAARRPMLDGGFVWTRKGSAGSITRLVAGTVALTMFDHLPAARSFKVHAATH